MFHLRLCLLSDGAAPRELSPVLAPNDNAATLRNRLNSLLEQMGLGPRHQTLAELSSGSGAGV